MMFTRVVAIVQARMSSQRFPGKVLARLPTRQRDDLAVIDWTVGRVRLARQVDHVVVATSDEPSDDPLVAHCERLGIDTCRGSLSDVLDRFYSAAVARRADVVVRVTADCPLVDPQVLDEVVSKHLAAQSAFTANRLPPPFARGFPIGLDVEVADFRALQRAWNEGHEAHHREHVMPYLYEEPGRFTTTIVPSPVAAGDVRWTVDAPADLEAVRALVHLADGDLTTPWQRLLEVWWQHPELAALNQHVSQRRASDVDPRSARGSQDPSDCPGQESI